MASEAMGWLEGLERDILHFVTCTLHGETIARIFVSVQSDKLGIPLILVCLALYGGWNAQRAWRATLSIALAVGVGMLIAGLLWAVVDRKRPIYHYDDQPEVLLTTPAELATCAEHPEAFALRPPARRSKRSSFPSRHALTVGVGIAVFWRLSRLLGVLATAYGLLVLVGRVYIARHWPSDMLAGCVLGIVLGILAWRFVPQVLRRLRHARFAAWIGEEA